MKRSAEGAAQQSPGRRRRSRPEPWVESAEVRALKGRRSRGRGASCAALQGLDQVNPVPRVPDPAGAGSSTLGFAAWPLQGQYQMRPGDYGSSSIGVSSLPIQLLQATSPHTNELISNRRFFIGGAFIDPVDILEDSRIGIGFWQ